MFFGWEYINQFKVLVKITMEQNRIMLLQHNETFLKENERFLKMAGWKNCFFGGGGSLLAFYQWENYKL